MCFTTFKIQTNYQGIHLVKSVHPLSGEIFFDVDLNEYGALSIGNGHLLAQ